MLSPTFFPLRCPSSALSSTLYSPFLTALTSKGFSPNFARSLLKTRDRSIRVYLKKCDNKYIYGGENKVRMSGSRVISTAPNPGSLGHEEDTGFQNRLPDWGRLSFLLGLSFFHVAPMVGSMTHLAIPILTGFI